MMREIKFKREHFDNNGIHIGTTEWGKLGRGYFISPSTKSNEDATKAVDRQFTGLKDKSGVEIYEGDIVNIGHEPYTSEDDDGNDIEVYESEHKSAVRWAEDGTAFVVHGGPYGFFGGEYDSTTLGWATYDGEYEYEVIGNIYENPGLLGGGAPA